MPKTAKKKKSSKAKVPREKKKTAAVKPKAPSKISYESFIALHGMYMNDDTEKKTMYKGSDGIDYRWKVIPRMVEYSEAYEKAHPLIQAPHTNGYTVQGNIQHINTVIQYGRDLRRCPEALQRVVQPYAKYPITADINRHEKLLKNATSRLRTVDGDEMKTTGDGDDDDVHEAITYEALDDATKKEYKAKLSARAKALISST